MKTNRILIAGIVGGVSFFILGWLIYGVALASYTAGQNNPDIMRSEMKWWALIISNLAWGFLLTFICDWSNARTLFIGAGKGAIIGVISAIAIDLGLYSMYSIFTGLATVAADILASTVMFCITGAIIGWILGRYKKQVILE